MKKTIRCMIVDDEPLAIELLTGHLRQMPEFELVSSTSNPIEALSVLKDKEVDLLFLDIQMPVLTGIELLKTLSSPPSVIFTTAYREYAVESYELKVVDYLVKPITFMRFLKAVNRYVETKDGAKFEPIKSDELAAESIFVNVNKKYVKVVFAQILYIESVKDYIHIHTKYSGTIITKDTITEFGAKLPNQFLRIHRSFIINKNTITAFTAQDVEIGEKELPIGQSYKKSVLEELK